MSTHLSVTYSKYSRYCITWPGLRIESMIRAAVFLNYSQKTYMSLLFDCSVLWLLVCVDIKYKCNATTFVVLWHRLFFCTI